MKKVVVIVTLVSLVCASVFSKGEQEIASTARIKKVALVMQKGGLGDLGFNDSAYSGLVYCKTQYGIEINAVECTDSSQGQEIFRSLCEEGYHLILNLEAGISGDMYHVAMDYPEIYFCAIGRQLRINAVDGVKVRPVNVIESYITLNEHSFLAGIVAAYVATDGNEIVSGVGRNNGNCNIGVLFGADSVGFYQYGDGFRQGVYFLNPNANVYIDYSVGFSDTANAQVIATNMIKNMGCDVIWTCCGTAGLGGLEATRLNNVYGIGVDTNQDSLQPGHIITSAVRDNKSLVEYYVSEFLKKGKLEQTKPDVFNLSNGGVNITDMSVIGKYVTEAAKFEELKSIVTKARQWISEGKIIIFDARLASIEQNGLRLDEWMKTSGKFVTYAHLSH
ncbi:BMP family ABC transporter substrate-binding protein [Treponema parvum]|uniref:BMP family ABC transporter substrate-binding protein n=1 Tax=Treponema parvum TaxID=138851 RepID=A0A975F2A7_9SPIR|nr:BMP family ABC transporter substrate-binding protein [Treponema parvum]QTQ12985.1 BMP family ABC transporter substrate-binding protein [Treponema parvum]